MSASCPFYPSLADVQVEVTVLLEAAVAHAQCLTQWNGLPCQTSAKQAMAECTACFTVFHTSRDSKSAVIKFTFIFTTSRFQVLLFPNWQNEQDSHSGDCSTAHRPKPPDYLPSLSNAACTSLYQQKNDSTCRLWGLWGWRNRQTMHAKNCDHSLHHLKQGNIT